MAYPFRILEPAPPSPLQLPGQAATRPPGSDSRPLETVMCFVRPVSEDEGDDAPDDRPEVPVPRNRGTSLRLSVPYTNGLGGRSFLTVDLWYNVHPVVRSVSLSVPEDGFVASNVIFSDVVLAVRYRPDDFRGRSFSSSLETLNGDPKAVYSMVCYYSFVYVVAQRSLTSLSDGFPRAARWFSLFNSAPPPYYFSSDPSALDVPVRARVSTDYVTEVANKAASVLTSMMRVRYHGSDSLELDLESRSGYGSDSESDDSVCGGSEESDEATAGDGPGGE